MATEGTESDKKSLRLLQSPRPDWDALACDCVGFANARGGCIQIGIEDGQDTPPASQRIDEPLIESLRKRIPQLTVNVNFTAHKSTASNSGELIDLRILRAPGIAATTDGRYFIRVADETKRLMPDELQRLMNDKSAYVWESHVSQSLPQTHADKKKTAVFLKLLRASERVSSFVKDKSDLEILEHYLLVKAGHLTNLGVLWIGRREDRATLLHAPIIQFIKYDERGAKVNKITWDDFSLNPFELIEAVWTQVPDWRESYELPDGLFRKTVPHFDEVVIRELLANALVHRPYTTRGDIFLNLYPERLEIHNPGLLPLGVTPANILHTTVKRNELLAKVFYDLKLMEREGTGYDRIYEALLASGRPAPVVTEGNDRVTVAVQRRIVRPEIVDFLAKADQQFNLTQRERIVLGLIAQHEALTASDMVRRLELRDADALRSWVGRLVDLGLVLTNGKTKGKEYRIQPEVLRTLDFKGHTSLKGIEKHRLRELVLRDLEIYREAGISQIHARIGKEIPLRRLRRAVDELRQEALITPRGERKGRRYFINQNTPK
jgi:ATP-dependent DNA helicase RecG